MIADTDEDTQSEWQTIPSSFFLILSLLSSFPSLFEKCPNTNFLLLCIFLYSDWIQENTDQKKRRIWTLFTQFMAN